MLNDAKLFLLDMDGTLYLGDDVIDGAHDFICTLEETGRKYIYLTNNSSRAGEDYIPRLRGLGFPCEKENIFTSGMATVMYLREKHPDARVFPVGTAAFCRELEQGGVNLTEDDADVVVVGFDTELSYRKLELAVKYLRRGAHFVAANPDWVCPMPHDEVLPDCGSICALLTASTGAKPYYIGKPNREMVDIISRKTGVANENIACVGDRLYTDIAVAQNAGAISICVLSGESCMEDIAAAERKPDMIFPSVKELAEALKG